MASPPADRQATGQVATATANQGFRQEWIGVTGRRQPAAIVHRSVVSK